MVIEGFLRDHQSIPTSHGFVFYFHANNRSKGTLLTAYF